MDDILQVQNLKKYFETPRGYLHAVDDVSFSMKRSTTLGVVGESGCGKSTLGRLIIGLLEPTSGKVLFNGRDITSLSKREKNELKTRMQIIFQDPYSSLDPRKSVYNIIAEPLRLHKVFKKREQLDRKVAELMATTGLDLRFAKSFPHEMDGGRRQRVGIARALALEPEFIVCDEPVSALDVSIQAQILNLLQDLQEKKNYTYIFVTHNLTVVKHIADEIMVMYLGCIVEKCGAKELFDNPLHPYTNGLLLAIPEPDIHKPKSRGLIRGEIASPINPAPGCRFAARCLYTNELCRTENPELREEAPSHFVACHRCQEIRDEMQKR